jgi:hypothetical protein
MIRRLSFPQEVPYPEFLLLLVGDPFLLLPTPILHCFHLISLLFPPSSGVPNDAATYSVLVTRKNSDTPLRTCRKTSAEGVDHFKFDVNSYRKLQLGFSQEACSNAASFLQLTIIKITVKARRNPIIWIVIRSMRLNLKCPAFFGHCTIASFCLGNFARRSNKIL